jgi:hypothetical protein
MILKLILGLILISITSCAGMPGTLAVDATPLPNGPRLAALGGKKAGSLYVWIYSDPNPPVTGENAFEVYIGDENNQPVADAKLSFDLDMTTMSHGKNFVSAEALGDGFYAGNVLFMMPGVWRNIITIDYGGESMTVRFDFNVK